MKNLMLKKMAEILGTMAGVIVALTLGIISIGILSSVGVLYIGTGAVVILTYVLMFCLIKNNATKMLVKLFKVES